MAESLTLYRKEVVTGSVSLFLRQAIEWPHLFCNVRVFDSENTIEEIPSDFIMLRHESGKIVGQQLNHPTVELQRTIIEQARKRNYLVVVHATNLQDTLDVLEAGVNEFTHTFCKQPAT